MNRLFICHKSIKSKLITMNFQDFLVFQQPRTARAENPFFVPPSEVQKISWSRARGKRPP